MACAGFDGQVVRQDSKLNHLADKFVKVRLVQMKDVDLSQFQFDYDLTWSVISMNPDGTIYGRYGSRSVGGPMTYNSMVSLEKAMERVLVLHHNYPRNRKSLNGKNHPPPHWKTAADIPGLRKRRRKQLIQPTNQKNCVHCHNIYDGWIETAYDQGTFDQQSLWIYPLPKNIGFKINVDQGNLVEAILPDSLAQKAGIQAGDRIVSMKDQPIDAYASRKMAGWIEEVHKGLESLRRKDSGRLLNARFGLSWGLMNVMRVQRGVLVTSDNTTYTEVTVSIGNHSTWAILSRKAFGLDSPMEIEMQVKAGL